MNAFEAIKLYQTLEEEVFALEEALRAMQVVNSEQFHREIVAELRENKLLKLRELEVELKLVNVPFSLD